MRIFLQLTAVLLLVLNLWAAVIPQPAYAATCSSLGGTCKSGTTSTGWCSSSEDQVAAEGCPSGGGFTTKCCVPKASISPTTCYDMCINLGNTPGECQGLPSCSDPAPSGTSAGCEQQCVASGNTQSECAGLPSCYDAEELQEAYGIIESQEAVDCVEIGIGPCIPTDPVEFAQRALEIGMGVGTLLAVLFLILGGIGVATSGGNPDNLEKAKKQITAAVAGLLFILLSVLILDIIGVSILGFDFI